MTKLFLSLCLLAAVAGLIWAIRVGGADGSWLAIVVPAVLGGGTALYQKRVTGSYTSDSAGGH